VRPYGREIAVITPVNRCNSAGKVSLSQQTDIKYSVPVILLLSKNNNTQHQILNAVRCEDGETIYSATTIHLNTNHPASTQLANYPTTLS